MYFIYFIFHVLTVFIFPFHVRLMAQKKSKSDGREIYWRARKNNCSWINAMRERRMKGGRGKLAQSKCILFIYLFILIYTFIYFNSLNWFFVWLNIVTWIMASSLLWHMSRIFSTYYVIIYLFHFCILIIFRENYV